MRVLNFIKKRLTLPSNPDLLERAVSVEKVSRFLGDVFLMCVVVTIVIIGVEIIWGIPLNTLTGLVP